MRLLLASALACAAITCTQAAEPIQAPTRITPYDWQCQDADGNKISDHQRIELAHVACLNNPAGAFIQGGRYRVNRPSEPLPEPPPCPAKPADETRAGTCPAGTTGTWTQTLTYSSAASPICWQAGEWSPSSPPAGACNRPPTLTGTPIAAVVAGTPYSFVPVAADPDADTLAFTIVNRPTWATFNAATGALTGTPTTAQIGVYSSITITVSDGKASASTTAFSITVTAPPVQPSTPTAVLICTGNAPFNQLFAACTGTTLGQPTNTQPVLYCASSTAPGAARETCPSATWYNWSGIQSFSVVLTDAGWYPRSALPPPALTAVTALGGAIAPNTANPANVDVTLSWVGAAGATGYDVERCPGASCTTFLAIEPATASPYVNTNLPRGLTYTYRVRAFDATRKGPYAQVTVAIPTAPPPATGTATLSWTPPTTNTDGSVLTDLAGFRIVYGTAPGSLTRTIQVANAGVSKYVVDQLAAGAWYFAVSAYSAKGFESDRSSVVTRVVQ